MRALEPTRTKVILIDNDIIAANNTELPLNFFIENLIGKYYKLNSSLRSAKPLTIVLNCNTSTLQEVKKFLIDNEILFNDGYEDLKFSTQIFNREPLVNTTTNGVKILKASYLVKLISKETLINNISNVTDPSVFINFSNGDVTHKFNNAQFFDFKYCEDLQDVYKILTL